MAERSERAPSPDEDGSLRAHVRVRVAIGLAFLVPAIVIAVSALTLQAEARAFVREGVRVDARVVGSVSWEDGPDDRDRIIVELPHSARTVRRELPVFFRARYPVGSTVPVVYDGRDPNGRVLVVAEPYDITFQLFTAALLTAIGLAVAGRALWWSRRVRVLAATGAGGFAVRAFFGGSDVLMLHHLDAKETDPPALIVPLVAGHEGEPVGSFVATARGELVDHGVVVVAGRDRIWWPRKTARRPDAVGQPDDDGGED